MVEKIGDCVSCNKTVYCTNGFLNGVVINTSVYCFACAEKNDHQSGASTNKP